MTSNQPTTPMQETSSDPTGNTVSSARAGGYVDPDVADRYRFRIDHYADGDLYPRVRRPWWPFWLYLEGPFGLSAIDADPVAGSGYARMTRPSSGAQNERHAQGWIRSYLKQRQWERDRKVLKRSVEVEAW